MTFTNPAMPWAHVDVESLATRREGSLFVADVEKNRDVLTESLAGCRIAIVGAAGSIGRAVLGSLLPFGPRSVALLDLDENGLVEIVRDLRSMRSARVPRELEVLPIGLGSRECQRYFEESLPFDYIVNLAAMKHVRSEKDVYSLARMIDTNVAALESLLSELPYACRKVFSVSSDKAVRPANLMGASKRIMEGVLLRHSGHQAVSTARFANVAFSNGSLPAGFLMRLQKRQPLAAPTDVERHFLSHEEAGQLCLLSVVCAANREVYVPKREGLTAVLMDDLAASLLRSMGYEPYRCASEQEARERVEELIARRKWPCHFAPSDTTGEKPVEEFSEGCEIVDCDRYQQIGVIEGGAGSLDAGALNGFLEFVRRAGGDARVSKRDYVREVQRVVPTLQHEELDRSLDEKM